MAKHSVIFIVDTGIDDGTAIIAGAMDKNLDIQGIVAVNGNKKAAQVAKNTLDILQFIGKNIPVFAIDIPRYTNTKFNVSGVHNGKGLGDYVFPKLKQKTQSYNDFINLIPTLPEKIDIINIAPLTALTHLLSTYPQFKEKINNIILQTGLLADNTYSSFNVAYDPQAMEMLLSLKMNILICPSDMGHNAYLNKQDVETIKNLNKTGAMLEYIFRSYKDRVVQNNVATHDSCAVFALCEPKQFNIKPAKVFVRYTQDIGILNFDFTAKDTNAKVCIDINKENFKKFLIEHIKLAP